MRTVGTLIPRPLAGTDICSGMRKPGQSTTSSIGQVCVRRPDHQTLNGNVEGMKLRKFTCGPCVYFLDVQTAGMCDILKVEPDVNFFEPLKGMNEQTTSCRP